MFALRKKVKTTISHNVPLRLANAFTSSYADCYGRSVSNKTEPSSGLDEVATKSKDPEKLGTTSVQHFQSRRRYMEKTYADPEKHQKELAKCIKYRAHPETIALGKAARQKRYNDDHKYRSDALLVWVRLNARVHHLSWRTHYPEYYEKPVHHHCSGCETTHRTGRKVWWRRKSEPELYDCHKSFTDYYSNDWESALPIGHEKRVFTRRKTKLAKSDAASAESGQRTQQRGSDSDDHQVL